MPPLQPQQIRNIGVYGLIRESSVDSSLKPEGAVSESVNFHFDRIGAATVRPGLTAFGGTVDVGEGFLALFNAGSSSLIAATRGGGGEGITVNKVPNVAGALTWVGTAYGGASQSGIVTEHKARFVDFAGYTLFIPVVHAGTFTSVTSSLQYGQYPFNPVISGGNPLNTDKFMDGSGATDRKSAKFGEVYKSRLYLAGDHTDRSRLFFSTVITSAGNINWSPTIDYVDINPGDGENITGLKRFLNELLVFKPNYTYRFRTSGLDPDPMIRVGTRSQESIIEGKRGLYFHHDTGFYRYAGGVRAEEISRPIADIVDAIPFGQRDDIVAWKDSDHIYWSLAGNVTVDDPKGSVTFSNCVARYTESSDVWTIYSYGFQVGAGAPFVTGTTSSIVIGLNNGVAAEPRGTTDVGQPIGYRLSTKWYEWEGIETKKTIQEMCAVAEKGMGIIVSYQTDDYEDWKSLSPDLRKLTTYFIKPTKKFNRIRFRVSGVSQHESGVFLGIEIYKGINEGVIR